MRKLLCLLKVASALIPCAIGPALAEEHPDRTITVIVPYTVGGPSDIAIRLIGNRLSQALGQPVVVENVGGAGGMMGTAKAARASPDG